MTRYFLYDTHARTLIRHSIRVESEADRQREEYSKMTGGHDIRVLKIIDPVFTHEDVAHMIEEYNIYGDVIDSKPKNPGIEGSMGRWNYKFGKVVEYTRNGNSGDEGVSHAQKSGTKA